MHPLHLSLVTRLKRWCREDLNLRPPGYPPGALSSELLRHVRNELHLREFKSLGFPVAHTVHERHLLWVVLGTMVGFEPTLMIGYFVVTVGEEGLEPPTSALNTRCSFAELLPRVRVWTEVTNGETHSLTPAADLEGLEPPAYRLRGDSSATELQIHRPSTVTYRHPRRLGRVSIDGGCACGNRTHRHRVNSSPLHQAS